MSEKVDLDKVKISEIPFEKCEEILRMRAEAADRRILAKANKDKEVLGMVAKGKITVVDFYATWCGPCQMLGEELKKIRMSL